MIGVYGGSFDPIHLGHLKTAKFIKNELGLNRILLLPCNQPVHRQPLHYSASQRLEILNLALNFSQILPLAVSCISNEDDGNVDTDSCRPMTRIACVSTGMCYSQQVTRMTRTRMTRIACVSTGTCYSQQVAEKPSSTRVAHAPSQ